MRSFTADLLTFEYTKADGVAAAASSAYGLRS